MTDDRNGPVGGRLYAGIPARLDDEVFETLCVMAGVRIERILSRDWGGVVTAAARKRAPRRPAGG